MLDLAERNWFIELIEKRSEAIVSIFQGVRETDDSLLDLRLVTSDLQSVLVLLLENADDDEIKSVQLPPTPLIQSL